MKKIAVILCVLLSLLMIISCAEPDNNPGGTGSDIETGTGDETQNPA